LNSSLSHRLGVAALALVSAAGAQAATYRIVDLGRDVQPFQINKQGDMAGQMSRRKAQEPVVYRAGRWKTLPPKGSMGYTTAINGGGDVVGTYYLETGGQHPTLWPRAGEPVELPMPEGVMISQPWGISADQVVVGTYAYTDPEQSHCFRWSAGDGFADLGFMARGDFCYANAINRAGTIVGLASVTPKGPGHAFLNQNGVFRNLGTLGGNSAGANGINDHGHIVGYSSLGTDPDQWHAFLWTGGVMKDIGASSDFANTEATSINSHGEIVGDGTGVADGAYHALRFADGQVVALETEVEDLADWKLEIARSINEDGVIAGKGTRPDGIHGFELVPIAASAASR
jgi:probable HAF family extracellular repeat protein